MLIETTVFAFIIISGINPKSSCSVFLLNFKLFCINRSFLNAYTHGESSNTSEKHNLLKAVSPSTFPNTGPSTFSIVSPLSFNLSSLYFIISISSSIYFSNSSINPSFI